MLQKRDVFALALLKKNKTNIIAEHNNVPIVNKP